ncbi:aminoglycoside phosphotransferase family protein [Streptacidiphilus griseoplanus]|uniref:aminoglycoside phosphotransferase family protein n=1 Tax=Peterkaempfera griseoplana TaxID=66896 RepID=UPI0006E1C3AA|nr:aminoglycoside phosphotransferase family protein [Peterkaempfera griseoplana]
MPAAISIPQRLDRIVRARKGEPGAAWLAALPSVTDDYLDRWQLTAERVCEPGGRTSLVVYVRRADGSPAALKVGMAAPETAHEHTALAHWDGRGAVRLLDADTTPEHAVLLLERLHGDIPLRSLPEAKAMLEAAGLLQRLWVAPPPEHPFPDAGDHARALHDLLRTRRELPAVAAADVLPLVDEALEAAAGLLASAPPPAHGRPDHVLLHGDFHHGNVLAADRMPWLAVDPRPLVGERAWDLAWLARDRMETLVGSPGPEAAVRRRLHRLADSLEVDRTRLRGWTLFRTVEAGIRCLDAGDTAAAELWLEFAGRL